MAGPILRQKQKFGMSGSHRRQEAYPQGTVSFFIHQKTGHDVAELFLTEIKQS